MPVLEALRAAGVAVVLNGGGGSMKSQFKRADNSGARFALVFGADELARGQVAIKPLRQADAAQSTRDTVTSSSWAHELRNA
jgi:histidyl-tRNA synthetase